MSQQSAGRQVPRQRALRQDAIQNQHELVRAMGQLLKEDPASATMPVVAERAGLSLTTAYRYFPTLEHLHRKFMMSVIQQLGEITSILTSSGTMRFNEILYHWIQVVEKYGPAMVWVRSREGFLTRYNEGEPHTQAIEQVWARAIREMLAEHSIPQSQFPLALTLFNTLLNSREIIDIRDATGMSQAQLVQHFSTIYQAVLRSLRPETD